ncbi:MAG: zinc metallopeptidase [Anaerolineae bacterium]|nr:MAG: zinc metallopeptidase [Anaerolineae bacterium]
MFWNPTYLLFALPALLLAFYAQYKVQSALNNYSRVENWRGLSGLDVARHLLQVTGLQQVNLEGTRGRQGDQYDPRSKTLRLSDQVARGRSIAAASIVAHEVGHALQDAQGYAPLKLRSGLVPAASLGSWMGPILFFLGLFISPKLAWVGVGLFALAAVFTLVTLPVEFNASRRALELLKVHQLADGRQMTGAKKVLDAAALTYVAALAQALSTLLYYVFLLTGFRRDD